jgi:hypothetical protein
MIPGDIPACIASLIQVVSNGGGSALLADQLGRARVTDSGASLEVFAKNFYSGSLGKLPTQMASDWEVAFSFLGSKNQPPDFMVKGGDAVEVKIASGQAIQLNSSPPKQFLYSTDPRINRKCVEAELWTKKDFVYFVGALSATGSSSYVSNAWIIDGSCVAATDSTYSGLSTHIRDSLLEIETDGSGSSMSFLQTKELGQVRGFDQIGTTLRIRGMWIIPHPAKIFQSFFLPSRDSVFTMNVLLSQKKFMSYPDQSRTTLKDLRDLGLVLNEVEIPSPSDSNSSTPAVHIGWQYAIS